MQDRYPETGEEMKRFAAAAVRMFPLGCLCSSYGRGLTMTRVTSPSCPVHGERLLTFEEYSESVADDDAL